MGGRGQGVFRRVRSASFARNESRLGSAASSADSWLKKWLEPNTLLTVTGISVSAVAVIYAQHVELRGYPAKFASTIDALGATTNAKIDALGATTNAKIDALGATTDAKIDALSATTNSKIDTLSATTNSKFDSTNAKIDALSATTNSKIDSTNAKIDALGLKFDSLNDFKVQLLIRMDKAETRVDDHLSKGQGPA